MVLVQSINEVSIHTASRVYRQMYASTRLAVCIQYIIWLYTRLDASCLRKWVQTRPAVGPKVGLDMRSPCAQPKPKACAHTATACLTAVLDGQRPCLCSLSYTAVSRSIRRLPVSVRVNSRGYDHRVSTDLTEQISRRFPGGILKKIQDMFALFRPDM